MGIYNENMELIQNPDLTKGRLIEKTRTEHHPAVEAVEEVWHYEVIKEYPNGGKDVQRVVDVAGVEASPAWDEEITYYIYHEYTAEELAEMEANNHPSAEERIAALEEQLAAAKILLGVE